MTPGTVSVLTPQGFEAALALAKTLVDSGFLPRAITKPAQALAVILAGQELGLPPMQSLRQIHIVEGKPTLSAELMLSQFKKRGGRAKWLETTDAKAVLWLRHPNGDEHTQTWSIEDAKRAGLVGKDNWRKYPADMIRARCASAGLRCIGEATGFYDPDEMGMDVAPVAALEAAEPGPKAPPSVVAVGSSSVSATALSTPSGPSGAPTTPTDAEFTEREPGSDDDVDDSPSNDVVDVFEWIGEPIDPRIKSRTNLKGEWVSKGPYERRTDAQNRKLHALKRELGIEDAAWKERLVFLFSKESSADLAKHEANILIDKLERRKRDHGTKADKDAKQANRLNRGLELPPEETTP
jgi:hypothetical protein